jgi:RimJ/RimL family protein N-acetyltransferase
VDAFRPEFDDLSASSPEWGKIALLPWDEEVFGFPVADFQLGPNPPGASDLPMFVSALEEYSARTKARLVSTHAPGDNMSVTALFESASFSLVEFSLVAKFSRLESEMLPPPSQFALRDALPGDHDSICRIAGAAFQFGRYHTDPRFPRYLANALYAHWMRNALSGSNPNNFVFVLGHPGEVVGFMDVVIRDGRADLRLGAVDPGKNLGFSGAGFSLYVESVRAALELGAKSVTAKIASANTRVLNVFSRLGFLFSKPEAVFHWHAPDFIKAFVANSR